MTEEIKRIKAKTNLADRYRQFQEEAIEVAKAAGDVARVLEGRNPTPKSLEEVMTELKEEFSDLMLVAKTIDLEADALLMQEKSMRWDYRLTEGC